MAKTQTLIRGLTGFIVRHAGVSYWLAALIKYAVFTAIIGGGVWASYSRFTKHHQQIGYDKCKSEQSQGAAKHKEFADGIDANRSADVDKGKEKQRQEDMVTRQEYNDLKQEKDDDEILFNRLLQAAMSGQNKDGSPKCANSDMPVGLQRWARPQANDYTD